MKPKNFPERKNQRRIDAAERLANGPYDKIETKIALENTLVKIVDNARDVRTKKFRG